MGKHTICTTLNATHPNRTERVVSKRVAELIRKMRRTKKGSKTYNFYFTGITSDGRYSPLSKLPEKWQILLDAPFKISEECCNIMKKKPMQKYKKTNNRKEFIGLMADEGQNREKFFLKYSCNIFQKNIQSNPLSIWVEKDIWKYIKSKNIPYCNIYDMGVRRTGCMFCMFGVHLEKQPNRFQAMKYTHPKLWKYCIHQLGLGKVLDHIGINYGNMDLRDFF